MRKPIAILALLVIVTLMLLMTWAYAQPEPNWQVNEWAASLAAFAGGVVAIVALIRRYLWKDLDGPIVQALAIGVGVAVGAALGAMPGAFDGIVTGAWNGLLAGAASFLGVDVVREVVQGHRPKDEGEDDSGKVLGSKETG